MMTTQQRDELVEVLCSAFDEASLAQLVRFNLGQESAAMIPLGPRLRDVVVGLIDLTERRGSTQTLMRAIYDARPQNRAVRQIVARHFAEATALDQTPRSVARALNSLNALREYRATPVVRDTLVRLSSELVTLRESIETLGRYARLLNLMRQMRNSLNILPHLANVGHSTESGRGSLRDSAEDLQEFARTAREVARRLPGFRVEESWINSLERGVALLSSGVDASDESLMNRGIDVLRRVIVMERNRISALFGDTANRLRVDRLVEYLGGLAEELRSFPSDVVAHVRACRNGLGSLAARLNGVVEVYSEWAWIENELEAADTLVGAHLERFPRWDEFKERVLGLCNVNPEEPYSARLIPTISELEAAGLTGDRLRFDLRYGQLRTIASTELLRVSTLLTELGSDLLRLVDPLGVVLSVAKLPWEQLEQICGAFLATFNDVTLGGMLRLKLDKDLDGLVKKGSLRDMIFELLTVAENQGWLNDLLRAARNDNPGNRALQCEAITRLVGPDTTDSSTFRSSIPNNLPRLQPFFGREKELAAIRTALDPESRTWGALIDGPGGMGKTSLAVRAAYDCPADLFRRIIFVSLKDRELDEDGVRPLGNLLVPGFLEMLNEIARELGQPDIAKSPEDQRVRLVLDALRPTQVLLILDNLESLSKSDRDQLITFVYRLPAGCKAILTSRRRIGSGADTLILQQLDEDAALATLAELARRNRLLARTTEAERIELYTKTGGKPLLLRWVAGQLGRGSCRTLADALHFLSACPAGNDPLEFVFGDLATEFTPEEERVLVALTYFAFPAKVEHVAAVAGLDRVPVEPALGALSNRSLVVPNQEETTYALVPLVAEFLRKHRPEVVRETGARLEERAYALVVENGYQRYDRFPMLDAAWPTVAPALPLFLAGPNPQLQTVCEALVDFLEFTGRWDEWLSLCQQAEARAVAAGSHNKAGWRAYQAGCIHNLREEAEAVLACADRAEAHWRAAKAGPRESAVAIRLRGWGHHLRRDYPAAIAAYREALPLIRSLSTESEDVASAMNSLARAEQDSGDFAAAERDYREALRVARALGSAEGVPTYTGNLAELALHRKDWPTAAELAREALPLAEKVGRKVLVAHHSLVLATALVRQGKATEAQGHARRAVDLFTELGSPELAKAQAVLRECGG